ncbi:type II toxin-antitoxin system death-on-curing family toxin [Peribacillus cavernae]|uniref:Type II toxin-antitoxin system death-on-curing family toxin n=1 Tax=Peribacillus cavernae TaxID=1674310 RepID=A0A433HJF9_9BACI|nr:type II toxin-antitoxin system death-on-curing family toxin [Peribacillus cavernae]MDQ0219230.1 death-on-curing protein [Peribacillus cavernae]RUQ28556.1 type II toxin-antitoxin system death-on-curing family toxin [Peribacillus cavernae]
MAVYFNAEEVLTIHLTIMSEHDDLEQSGIKFPGRFASMLERPRTILFGQEQYPSIFEKACCYYHSIATEHIFHNGNKRTALTVFLIFLEINGHSMVWTEKQAEDFTVKMTLDERYKGNNAISNLTNDLRGYFI